MDKFEKVLLVDNIQAYIKANLRNRITLKMLAEHVNYSPWHVSKVFKEIYGINLFDYLRDLRLSEAALTLRDGNQRVIDVALDFLFDSHEGFTRAFSKKFGIAPKEYSNNPKPIRLFMPSPLIHHYHLKGGISSMKEKQLSKSVFVQVVERPARKAIIKRGVKAEHYFDYCEEVSCDVWGILCSIKDALYEPCSFWLPKNLIKQGTSLYVQGVEVSSDYRGEVPDGFELIDLEPCKLMVFQGEPFEDDDFCEAIEELQAHIRTFNPKIYGYEWAIDEAPSIQLEPQGYRGYIEAKPVRLIN